ncbi:MAG: glycosyltransferase family 4 protein [Firmicutes bacterium]|nr:glycosyltransferase family 4 protein [Bacillota bacterium]
MRIAILGPYPRDGLGGIAVYLDRLTDYLEKRGHEVFKIDTNKNKRKNKLGHLLWIIENILFPRVDVLHLNTLDWLEMAVFVWACRMRRIKTVATIHSFREEISELPPYKRACAGYFANSVDYIIAVGQKENEKLKESFKIKNKSEVIKPFIKPQIRDTALPIQVEEFIKKYKTVISANGSNNNRYKGRDIYGLDMLIELGDLLRWRDDIGIIYCQSKTTDRENLAAAYQRVDELNLGDRIHIVTDKIEFWPVLMRSSLFIRPTRTDSYGISVAEAITLGVPAIASDVCRRPEGTVTFRCGDIEDLYSKVTGVLDNYDYYCSLVSRIELDECTPDIERVYKALLGSNATEAI